MNRIDNILKNRDLKPTSVRHVALSRVESIVSIKSQY